jgi:Voltage gated calcium channel IQ domain
MPTTNALAYSVRASSTAKRTVLHRRQQVPPPAETGPNKLTVGKIFGGMLILENWKLTRFGTTLATTHKSLPVRKETWDTLAYYENPYIAAIKRFIVQAPGANGLNNLWL